MRALDRIVLLVVCGCMAVACPEPEPSPAPQEPRPIAPRQSVFILGGTHPDPQGSGGMVPWDEALQTDATNPVPAAVTGQLGVMAQLMFFGRDAFEERVRLTLGDAAADRYFDTIARYAIGHPNPQPRLAPSMSTGPDADHMVLSTGASLFREPALDPFTKPPGTNFLPTIYTNMYDGYGKEMPNTLPSTKHNPYNLHDGDPEVSEIDMRSPTTDLAELFDGIFEGASACLAGAAEHQQAEKVIRRDAIRASVERCIDILEGNPVPNRSYSGFPLLHYQGPNKMKRVEPVYDASGKVVGGNVDIHQLWYDNHIESDTALLDPTDVWDVPYTVTYTVDVLAGGSDDFSPFAIFTDDPHINNPDFPWQGGDGPPPEEAPAPGTGTPEHYWPNGLPHIGMDQSFFPMREGTRTKFVIKMPPGKYLHLIYTWGWRMHPPRIQSSDRATKFIAGKTLHQWETSVFGDDPTASEAAREKAIGMIGDLSPCKRMWNVLREARGELAKADPNYNTVIARTEDAHLGFSHWKNRGIMRLPRHAQLDPDSDLTLLFVNNTIYGQFKDGGIVDYPSWTRRGSKLKVTILNGDYFDHRYVNVDFGGSRGWENQYKSSVQYGGSGPWFTFGRSHWWVNNVTPEGPAPLLLPAADPSKPREATETHFEITYDYEPSRRLRFYQFDPTHHDVAILSIH